MNITEKQKEGATILVLEGSIDSKTTAEVQSKVLEVALATEKLILVFSDVTFVSSAGLRLLLMVYRQLSSKNGKVILVDVSEEIRDIMAMTGFIHFFELCETIEQALKSA